MQKENPGLPSYRRSALADRNLLILENQWKYDSSLQGQNDQPKHVMTPYGGDKGDAILAANAFVKERISAAINLCKSGKNTSAMEALMQATHMLQDATSPSHAGFQSLPGSFETNRDEWKAHVLQEIQTPKEGSPLDAKSAIGTTWAFDIFTGNKNMPNTFFKPNGRLNTDAY